MFHSNSFHSSGFSISHWGCVDHSDTSGSYSTASTRPAPNKAGVVLTEAGEVLIHRNYSDQECVVGILIGKAASALTRAQTEGMQRAWDAGLAVANGQSEAVHLLPVPHSWRFNWGEYMSWDEWLAANSSTSGRAVGEIRAAS